MWHKVTENLDRILDAFGIEYREFSNMFRCACPIHDGDNPTSLCIYKESGAWRCFTGGCHEKYGANTLGLIRGLLSKDREASVNEAINFIEDMIGGKLEFSDTTPMNYHLLYKDKVNNQSKVTRQAIRKRLEIPAEYFINRGFSNNVLDKYDVGLCKNKKSQFYNRCVVPIYDISYNNVIGYSGRDITERSKVKWLHSHFPRESTLYNSWFAKDIIKQENTCILVESPGNIWRLEEAGIHMGLAMFGTELSFNQMRLLSQLSVLNLVLLLDNDQAGKNATARIVKKLKGLYNIIIPEIKYGDVAECPIDYLKENLKEF